MRVHPFPQIGRVTIDERARIQNPEFDCVSSLILSRGEWVFRPRVAREGEGIWVMFGARRPAVERNESGNRHRYPGDVVICEDAEYTRHDAFSPIKYGQLVEDVNLEKLRRARSGLYSNSLRHQSNSP